MASAEVRVAQTVKKSISSHTSLSPDVFSKGHSRSVSSPSSIKAMDTGIGLDSPFLSPRRFELNISTSMSEHDLELLARLEAANEALESDKKSIKSFTMDDKVHHPSGEQAENGRKSSLDSSSLRSMNSTSSQLSSTPNGDCLEPELTSDPENVRTWSRLLNEWENGSKKKTQLIRDLVYKGIPHQFRCLAWQYLCSAENCSHREKYSAYLKQTSACEKVIRRDIARTYPEHEFFMEKDGLGQESLFNVMKAYSLYDREVGYCQGSAFIVGLLLMNMPEEEAFSVLIQLMMQYRLRELFKPGMAELGICLYQLEYLIQEQLPMLYQHFQAQSFLATMYASSWFLTLFTTQLPIEHCFRIMDVFLVEGMEIILKMGVAILSLSEADLLCMDMEAMLLYFQEKVPVIYKDRLELLIETAGKVKYNSKHMKKLEKEYSTIKSKETEDQVELRRLRSENRLLRQRLDNLEKENVTLADRLIQGQVTRAQEAEVMFSIKRELSRLQEQNKELQRSLSASEDQISELKTKNQEENVSSERTHALQEELIAVKLREAEANLALRELVSHVSDLDKEWQKQLERTPQDRLSKTQAQALHEELVTAKLKAAEIAASNKQLKMKIVELETSGQMTSNQVHRLLDENEKLRLQLSSKSDSEQETRHEVNELQNQLMQLQAKVKEDSLVTKIHDVEHSQHVTELRQRIAELEIRNQEFQSTNDILNKSGQGQKPHTQVGQLNRDPFSFDVKNTDYGPTDETIVDDCNIQTTNSNNNNKIVTDAKDSISFTSTKPKLLRSMQMDAPDELTAK